MIEALVVAVVVVACSLRAAWILMPAAARRALARALLARPLPRWLATPLERQARDASAGCACDGCDNASPAGPTKAEPPGVAPITLHRRLPR